MLRAFAGLLSTVAVITATPCTDALTSNMAFLTPLLAPSNNGFANVCTDSTKKDALLNALRSIVSICAGSLGSFKPLLEIVEENVCLVNDDSDATQTYCMNSLLNMLPSVFTIVSNLQQNPPIVPDFTTLDYMAEIKQKKAQVCGAPNCPMKIAHIAIEAFAKAGLEAPTFIKRMANEAAAGCVAGGTCLDIVAAGGVFDTEKACPGGIPSTCFRQMSSIRPEMANITCTTTDDKPDEKIATLVFNLPGVVTTFYQMYKAKIENMLALDLGFNLPGVLAENIDLDITTSTNSLTITVTLKGSALLSGIDLKAEVAAFADMLKSHPDMVTLPNLDTLANFSSVLMPSSALTLVSSEFENVTPPTAGSVPTPAEESSSLRTAATSSMIVVTMAIGMIM